MAEGERPELPQQGGEESLKKAVARSRAENRELYRKTDIGKHIAFLEANVRHFDKSSQPTDDSQRTRREIGLYSYFRDTLHTKTLGEVEDTLRTRKVAPDVVHLWVEQHMIGGSSLIDAVMEGYPEFEEDYRQATKERIADEASEAEFLGKLQDDALEMDTKTPQVQPKSVEDFLQDLDGDDT